MWCSWLSRRVVVMVAVLVVVVVAVGVVVSALDRCGESTGDSDLRVALQRGSCSQDIIGDARGSARAFDDGPGILAAENCAEVLMQLRKKEIN